MTTVFINGSNGTTGLRIAQRLGQRADVELLTLPEACRKEPQAQAELAVEIAERTWAAVERAKDQAALRDSEERLRRAQEGAHVGCGTGI